MYLAPYKIFALSSKKRLLNVDEPNRPVGIYDVKKMKYLEALGYTEDLGGEGLSVSILLGTVIGNTKLICLDLDDCFTPDGKLEKDTADFLKEFKPEEYEVSSSGEGIHVYILTNLDLKTFIVKDLEGCKSFECYTNKRHIVTTYFDFENTNLVVGKHDKFITDLYNRVNNKRDALIQDVKAAFSGVECKNDAEVRGAIFGRKPVTDMFTLRGLGYKDGNLIEIIDTSPDSVDQSAHDAKLIRKLMYYCLDFDAAWEMAKKTNYYKGKDKRHKLKFDNPTYKERTRTFIARGG
ncbi:MAG: hypothetical protein NC218_08180 [Acetobacter sp.]|nr:hypothetical protein [Acetobacter sp.]